MKQYSSYGYNDFIICAGYKQYVIKQYFADYYLHRSDITFDFRNGNEMTVHSNVAEPWRVTIIDTGLNTMTGGRIKRIKDFIHNEPFLLTYGDAVSAIDINKLVQYHKSQGTVATISAIQPGGRFGLLDIDAGGIITDFKEKRKKMVAGLTQAIWCLSLKYLILLKVMTLFLSVILLRNVPDADNLAPINLTAFGSVWTH